MLISVERRGIIVDHFLNDKNFEVPRLIETVGL